MQRWFSLALILFVGLTLTSTSFARHRHRHITTDANGNLVTLQTAAGIPITASASFAPKAAAFIADLVASGYTPKHIKCFARGGHVHGSRHYSGNACDIDQTGWGRTARAMHNVAALAKVHGVRDGCSFRDCGHIDDGKPLMRQHYDAPGTVMVASARRKQYRVARVSFQAPDRLTQSY